MNKRFILIILTFMSMSVMAQDKTFSAMFENYTGKKGYTTIYITKYMFELFAKVADDDDFKKMTQDLESIKVITSNKTNDEFTNDVNEVLSGGAYQDFMVVNDEGTEIEFKVKDEDAIITEFVMIVKSKKEPIVLFIEGEIDLATIAKMSKEMNVKGFEHLEKVENGNGSN